MLVLVGFMKISSTKLERKLSIHKIHEIWFQWKLSISKSRKSSLYLSLADTFLKIIWKNTGINTFPIKLANLSSGKISEVRFFAKTKPYKPKPS